LCLPTAADAVRGGDGDRADVATERIGCTHRVVTFQFMVT
jgi:hypothetical protein